MSSLLSISVKISLFCSSGNPGQTSSIFLFTQRHFAANTLYQTARLCFFFFDVLMNSRLAKTMESPASQLVRRFFWVNINIYLFFHFSFHMPPYRGCTMCCCCLCVCVCVGGEAEGIPEYTICSGIRKIL